MWPSLEGFSVILALILIFGIISLPARQKKAKSQVPFTAEISQSGARNQTSSNLTASQKGVSNGSAPNAYAVDQKIAASYAAAERK